MRSQQTESLAEVAVVPSALRQTHFGVVEILISAFAFAIDSKNRDGRTDGDGKQEQNGRRTETGDDWLAPAPTPGLLETGDGPRHDWLVAQEAVEFISEFLRGLITTRRFFLQTLQADRFEVVRDARREQVRRGRVVVRQLMQHVRQRLTLKRRPARQQMVEN